MSRAMFLVLISVTFIFGVGKLSFAQHDHSGDDQMMQMPMDDKVQQAAPSVSKEAVNVGNKICPVSGEKIDEKLKATYEYEGKIYNFCCTSCVEDFKKDPQKYIKKIEEEKLQEKSKQVE